MRTIEIEDYIYDYLRQRQTTFSESESQVLERELGLTPPAAHSAEVRPSGNAVPKINVQGLRDELLRDDRDKALWEFIQGPKFQSERNVVRKFLALLGFLHRENRDKFVAVESINGRTRKYFAKRESELTGTSINPKVIPGSDYWVVTNNSTDSKKSLLVRVLKSLGYRGGLAAVAALKLNP
jgi:negative modulator of initiation of replication